MTWYEQLGAPPELTALKAGDEALFTDLVRGLSPALLRLARSRTSTDAEAQDAVQDTWVVVVDTLDAFAGRSSLKTWVCGICLNTARRRGVRERRTAPFSSLWHDGGPAVDPDRFARRGDAAPTGTWLVPPVRWDTQPEAFLAEAELRNAVQRAIADLPVRQREVVTARDVLGLDAAEAAAVLGLSAGNQRVLLHRARSRVRAALEDAYRERRPPDPAPPLTAARPTADPRSRP